MDQLSTRLSFAAASDRVGCAQPIITAVDVIRTVMVYIVVALGVALVFNGLVMLVGRYLLHRF